MLSLSHVAAVLFTQAPPLESLFGMLRSAQQVQPGQGLGEVSMLRDHVRVELAGLGSLRASTYAAPWPDTDVDSLAELGGPSAGLYPGGLARAGSQDALWRGGEAAARAHRGFVHFAFDESARGTSRDRMEAIERVAVALLAHPDALCVYFAAGEALRDGHIIGQIRATATEQGALPLQLWVNGRIADAGMDTRIADLVGLAQIGLTDCEAVFPVRADLAPFEVLGFLLDVTHHLVREGGALEDGVVYEGPGGLRWRAGLDADAQIEPPRKVVRWIPLSMSDTEAP